LRRSKCSTALAIGLYASVISRWPANKQFSFGYHRVEVLSGFVNGVFLVLVSIFVLFEAMTRFFEPPEINTDRLLLVSVMGLCVNLIGVWSFSGHGGEHGGHSHSHGHSHGHGDDDDDDDQAETDGDGNKKNKSFNIDGVFLHVLADTLGSVGVIISTLMIQFLGWKIADPICSFILSLLIFLSVIPLVRSTGSILLLRTPKKLLDASAVLASVPGVRGVMDVHSWQLANGQFVSNARLAVAPDADAVALLVRARQLLVARGATLTCVELSPVSDGGRSAHTQSVQDTLSRATSATSKAAAAVPAARVAHSHDHHDQHDDHDHDHDHDHDDHHDHAHGASSSAASEVALHGHDDELHDHHDDHEDHHHESAVHHSAPLASLGGASFTLPSSLRGAASQLTSAIAPAKKLEGKAD
jgi:zinc transporter 5/7